MLRPATAAAIDLEAIIANWPVLEAEAGIAGALKLKRYRSSDEQKELSLDRTLMCFRFSD